MVLMEETLTCTFGKKIIRYKSEKCGNIQQLLFLPFNLKFSTRLNHSPGLAGNRPSVRICHPTSHGSSVWFIRCTVNNSHREGERHWECYGETCTVRLNLMNTLSFKTVMGTFLPFSDDFRKV